MQSSEHALPKLQLKTLDDKDLLVNDLRLMLRCDLMLLICESMLRDFRSVIQIATMFSRQLQNLQCNRYSEPYMALPEGSELIIETRHNSLSRQEITL